MVNISEMLRWHDWTPLGRTLAWAFNLLVLVAAFAIAGLGWSAISQRDKERAPIARATPARMYQAPIIELDPEARAALPPPPYSTAERECLARAVYFEARGESLTGQVAVAQVVVNRAKSGQWPSTLCGVVYQGVQRGSKCQFSFACYDKRQPIAEDAAWSRARYVADDVAAGRARLPELAQSYHYHTTEVRPVWSLRLLPVRTVGKHVFYAAKSPARARDQVAAVPESLPPGMVRTVSGPDAATGDGAPVAATPIADAASANGFVDGGLVEGNLAGSNLAGRGDAALGRRREIAHDEPVAVPRQSAPKPPANTDSAHPPARKARAEVRNTARGKDEPAETEAAVALTGKLFDVAR